MYKQKLRTKITTRKCICRICNDPIERHEPHVVLEKIKTGRNLTDIHFHTICIKKQIKNLQQEIKDES